MDSQTTLIVVALSLLLIIGGNLATNSSSDEMLLARLIDAEAIGEPYRGKVAVGAVVMNRVNDRQFPNTIRDVIYEPKQFFTEGLKKHRTASADSLRAARAAIAGEDPTKGALYFYNPKTAKLASWWGTRTQLIQIGNHVFLK